MVRSNSPDRSHVHKSSYALREVSKGSKQLKKLITKFLKNHKENRWKIWVKKSCKILKKARNASNQSTRVFYTHQSHPKSYKSKWPKINPSFQKQGFSRRSPKREGENLFLPLLRTKPTLEVQGMGTRAPNSFFKSDQGGQVSITGIAAELMDSSLVWQVMIARIH